MLEITGTCTAEIRMLCNTFPTKLDILVQVKEDNDSNQIIKKKPLCKVQVLFVVVSNNAVQHDKQFLVCTRV